MFFDVAPFEVLFSCLPKLLTVVFQDFQASFSQFFAIVLQTRQDAKSVGNRIATEFRRVRRASGLLFWRALEKTTRRSCGLLILRESNATEHLNQDEGGANFDVHCHKPDYHACLDDNRGGVLAFH